MLPQLRKIQLHFYAYLNYIVLFIVGSIRDLIDRLMGKGKKAPPPGYAPLLSDFSDFFTRRFYNRILDCFARVVTTNAGAFFTVKNKKMSESLDQSTYFDGEKEHVMNLGSYNYLGFGDPDDYCTPPVKDDMKIYGPGCCSTRAEFGTTAVHRELERVWSEYMNTEDTICFGMGFATNATVMPAIVGKGDLIISDSLNHNSIVSGARSSGATIRVFRHSEIDHLEGLLKKSICQGQPRTHKPWRKILVVVEGIYSMEGETAPLKEIIELKKRYKFYIWLDEAHSIGCMGETGRGITQHLGVNPRDVDILMGTFTKSFGGAGGYITGSKKLIDYLRLRSFGNVYADAMPAPVAKQIIRVVTMLSKEEEGKKRLKQLHENSVWFRTELKERGYDILGIDGSPVVPIIMPPFSIFTEVTRKALERGIGLVVVSFPACDILQGRVRICLNSVHTREELKYALDTLDDICKELPCKLK